MLVIIMETEIILIMIMNKILLIQLHINFLRFRNIYKLLSLILYKIIIDSLKKILK